MAARFPRRLLIDTVNIQRSSGSSVDERGNPTDNWSNATSGVKGRLTFIAETEDRDGRNTIVRNFSLDIPGEVDVKASDRIFEPSSGKYYEINSISQSRMKDGRVYYKTLSLLYRE
tara:strand:+ start:1294 stop:1641 length:348 start_codon:yes stop_codon:yes gene_type:complete